MGARDSSMSDMAIFRQSKIRKDAIGAKMPVQRQPLIGANRLVAKQSTQ
jgi:hypothetical protein